MSASSSKKNSVDVSLYIVFTFENRSKDNMIKKIAQEIKSQLVFKTRDNGETFVCFKDNAPSWMSAIARRAHDDKMPNDFSFQFFRDALEALIESDGEIDGAIDLIDDEIYNGVLLQWLSSNMLRFEYLNEVVTEKGFQGDFNIFDELRHAQRREKEEVLDLTFQALKENPSQDLEL